MTTFASTGTGSKKVLTFVAIVVVFAGLIGYAASQHSSASKDSATSYFHRHDPAAQHHQSNVAVATHTARPAPTATPDRHSGCDGAMYYASAATKSFNADSYQAAYDNAVAGLARVDSCDDNTKVIAQGYLLGNKALAEHHLSSGDSRVDINQATTLLAECQTLPGVYGTKTGAECESEEETLISYKTHWEMESYEQ